MTVDGKLLTQSVWKSARQGSLAAVPLIAGGQPGEWSLFSYFFGFLYKPHQKSMTISLNVSYAATPTLPPSQPQHPDDSYSSSWGWRSAPT